MFSSHVAARNTSVFSILCFSLGLLASSAAVSQEIEVVGGNSSNSLMFGLNYGVDDAGNPVNQAITLNTDANSYPSLNSFTFVRNTCGEPRTDVVAASTNASRLVIYAGGQGAGTPMGAGTPICAATGPNACPPRPVGLSTSVDGKISVATSGASGTTPGVFTFAAGDTEESCGNFTRLGGRLLVGTTIRAIADTEFVRADVGGLAAGDLLVLASNPAMIVHVAADRITENAASGTEFQSSASVFSGFRRATPTGLAVVPGETPNILVTLSTGAIVNFYINSESKWTWKEFDTGGLFPNPRGIGAGARDGVPYIVVSEQNRGRYIRQELLEQQDGSLARSTASGALREIVTPVGAPEGVAVSQEDPNVFIATKCFDPVSDGLTGCNFGPGELHFSQGFEGGLEGERVRFEVQFIPDPDEDLNRILDLKEYGFDGFLVPPTCRGYDTNPDGKYEGVPQLILIDIELLGDEFFVTSGNFAQLTEQVESTLGVDGIGGECTTTGSRVYYHPTKDLLGNAIEGGTLFDVTVSCENPSRGISEIRSPVVFCVDPIYQKRYEDGDVFLFRNEFVNPQVRILIDAAKKALDELQGRSELYGPLKNNVVGLNNPNNGNVTPTELEEYFRTLSKNADFVATEVLKLKRGAPPELGNFFTETPGLSEDLYARLLRSFLGLAFYAKETGLIEKYYPPAEFCKPFNLYNGVLYPELPDVKCDCSSALNPDYLCAFD